MQEKMESEHDAVRAVFDAEAVILLPAGTLCVGFRMRLGATQPLLSNETLLAHAFARQLRLRKGITSARSAIRCSEPSRLAAMM